MENELNNYFDPPKINISKEAFKKRIKFLQEYKAFKNRRKKAVTLEDIPDVNFSKIIFKKKI